MTGQEALALVERLLQTAQQQGLNDTQSAILLSVWEGASYPKIALHLRYEVDYIKQIAARLWKQIGQIIGENVSKSNLQSVLRRYQQTHNLLLSGLKDWGEAIDVAYFYGRQVELQTLSDWVLTDHCRLVGLWGLGGMGKTTLSIKLAQILQEQFEWLIWRSLRQAPLLKELLQDILPKLTNTEVDQVSVAALMEQLRQKRCLLILDNLDSILQGGSRCGQYQLGYEDYGRLFETICDQSHQSCLVLTSREKPTGFSMREGAGLPIRALQLQGLSATEAQPILNDKGLVATTDLFENLVTYLGGNPLALKIAATSIHSLAGGNIQTFLEQGSTVFGGLWNLLDQQFLRLSTPQQQVMYWLAINRESITPMNLQAKILPKLPLQQLLEILEVLRDLSLIETGESGLSQQSVIMEYVTEQFIRNLEKEIITETFHLFKTHALIEAQTQDYLREAQTQLILYPLSERLLAYFGDKAQLEQHLVQILGSLRKLTSLETGYAGGNLLNLLCYLKTDLRGVDFSQLTIRQAYLLDAVLHDADLRGAQVSQTVFAETFGGVFSVALSPDGRLAATSDTRGDIQVWQTQTNTQQLRFRAHQLWAWAVTFSPNGEYLASVSEDRMVKLWDAATGQCLHTYEGHVSPVNAVAFSPNGQMLASCGQDATIRLWQVLPQPLNPALQVLSGHQGRIWAIAFSPDGQFLVSGGEDCDLRIWDVSTGTCWAVWRGHERWIRALAFSPDSHQLASGGHDQTIKIWDVEAQSCLQTLQGHHLPVTAIAYAPPPLPAAENTEPSRLEMEVAIALEKPPQYLASSSFDRTLKLWDTSNGDCLKTLLGHNSRIWSVAYHPNGQELVSGGDDHTTKFWSLKTGRCTKTLAGHTNAILSLALSQDGAYLASGHEDQVVRIWNLQDGTIIQTLREHTNRVWTVAFQPGTNLPIVASGSADYTIKIWNWKVGQCLQTFQGHGSWIYRIIFSPDGKTLASTSYDQTARLWDVATGECLHTLQGHTGSIPSGAFSPCGQRLATGDFNGTIRVWDVSTGECLHVLSEHTDRIWSVTYSPDGQTILSGSFDHTLKLWDATSGVCQQTWIGHLGPICGAAFSPDGQMIVSGGFDTSVKLWQVATGECIQSLMGHTDAIFTLLVAPIQVHDTQSSPLVALSAGQDESIRVWDLTSQTCRATLRLPRPYEGMKIKGLKGLSEAQLTTLMALGAVSS
jgi:WD40 repeat protein